MRRLLSLPELTLSSYSLHAPVLRAKEKDNSEVIPALQSVQQGAETSNCSLEQPEAPEAPVILFKGFQAD